MKKILLLLIIFLSSFLPFALFAQKSDTISNVITLKQSINFALRNQPVVKQASIDQEINERDVRIGLAGWLPQINSSGQYQHYLKGSPVNTSGSAIAAGGPLNEFSALGLQASQVIYNNDVLLAS
ncbi:MAG: TolC family protein, partial [Mucilaginibacter sp.]|nr:TolC family protein [Mucilaginibacter sp.]